MKTKEMGSLNKRIAELEVEPRALVGSDEGTHDKPRTHRIYETITGERYATSSFAQSNATRCTEQEAAQRTSGRIVEFPAETARIRGLRRELARLREQAAAK